VSGGARADQASRLGVSAPGPIALDSCGIGMSLARDNRSRDFNSGPTLMAIAFVFPGQGSQSVGMGATLANAFPAARAVFNEVDDALREKLSDLMFNGPIETLTLTENAQPALMAVSMAVVKVLEIEKGFVLKDKVKFVAGHSLGEYSALAAAGALTIADAARLLKLRGRSMQAAVPVGQGAMAALLGVDRAVGERLAAAAAGGEVCQVANDNEPGQVVISGTKSAIERAGALAKTHGVRRFMPLRVSAPFHCALMQPAAEAVAQALRDVALQLPSIPIVANVVAQPITEPAEIKQRLIEQVTGTVRWRESVLAMAAAGVTQFCEIGPGKVLSGLVGRIDKRLATHSIGVPTDFDDALSGLAR
jgi:[acyl-carrier-protein] S-malonyltransferase